MALSPTFRLPRIADSDNPLRLAVFISGSGSGMEALLKHQLDTKCSHTTTIVISNIPGVAGLAKAEKYGIPTEVVELPPSLQRIVHEDMIHKVLINNNVEAIILSGYMRILSPKFISKWEGRLLNVHPSLLPNFPGIHAHRDALKAGANKSGCTVHFVDSGVDSGLIIAQSETSISSDDNEETLQKKVKKLEHTLYPQVIDAFSEGGLEISDHSTVIMK